MRGGSESSKSWGGMPGLVESTDEEEMLGLLVVVRLMAVPKSATSTSRWNMSWCSSSLLAGGDWIGDEIEVKSAGVRKGGRAGDDAAVKCEGAYT